MAPRAALSNTTVSGMISLITANLPEIKDLCREFGVRKLEVFGSAARGDFDPESSNVDVIVDFLDYGPGISDLFYGLEAGLAALLQRPVDFVFARKMRNPYFREAVDETMETVYTNLSRVLRNR